MIEVTIIEVGESRLIVKNLFKNSSTGLSVILTKFKNS
jgi:hypothetical protein